MDGSAQDLSGSFDPDLNRWPAIVDLSLIIPTRDEAPNVRPLLDRIAGVGFGATIEVIFVDDSDDETPGLVLSLRDSYEFDIRLVHRPSGERTGGLGGAVIAGIAESRGEFVCILDGDLQHPPERIPAMHEVARTGSADLVIGSRYMARGNADGLSSFRQAVSRVAGVSARMMLPRILADVTDPMSGFFLVRRDKVALARVTGDGFKIFIEIAAAHPDLRHAEVPYEFGERHAGETKASVSEGIRFLRTMRALRARRPRSGHFLYDIHGIIRVRSAAFLPEIQAFRVDRLDEPADINVRVGLSGTDRQGGVRFREWFGPLGFALHISREADVTEIEVSHLVARSPHVLYTNTVEPVLRWMFAERGFALVHAACIEKDGDAFFITARTDTGKTTTMLKVLDGSDFRFVSDDLTIVSSDGSVLPYPKPLTISAHTLHAVKRNRLTRLQRLGMPIQSRLHSKSGRTVGFQLAALSLPAATMSAIVQRLIPPPKYHIEDLVPDTVVSSGAQVKWLFVIERGGGGEVILEQADAMRLLLENCEDAYGFPPYSSIEPYLRGRDDGTDLGAKERSTISQAFRGVPALLLRSDSLDWAVRIADLIRAQSAIERDLAQKVNESQTDATASEQHGHEASVLGDFPPLPVLSDEEVEMLEHSDVLKSSNLG